MGFESIYYQYRKELKFVEQHITNFAESISEENSRNSVKYFLEKKGHLLRPVICLIAFECAKSGMETVKWSLGDEGPRKAELLIYKLAASLELLHSASLLHDDVIDEEKERRGQLSVNKAKGNKAAVLVGNIFYLNAFKLIVDPSDMKYYEAMLDTALNMCQGEILQSEKWEELLTIEDYLNIIEKKTAKLIELSCFFGASAAEIEIENVKKISRIGCILGLFYQIRDDKKDLDVGLKNEKELDVVCEKMHQEFLTLTRDLQDSAGLNMKKFLDIEQIVRP